VANPIVSYSWPSDCCCSGGFRKELMELTSWLAPPTPQLFTCLRGYRGSDGRPTGLA